METLPEGNQDLGKNIKKYFILTTARDAIKSKVSNRMFFFQLQGDHQ
jgi:hypothetical protein